MRYSLPPRAPASHKGTYGRALVIGGSTGMSGAISLSGIAALRSGAGLVQVAVPEPIWPVVAAAEPSLMTLPLPSDSAGRLALSAKSKLEPALNAADAVAIGPGIGCSAELTELIEWLFNDLATPLICDADALNALAELGPPLGKPRGPRILTPHPGEFARLIGRETGAVQAARVQLAEEFASRWGVILILKGQHSVITDGRETLLNPTGNPGMATGGTGDVLTGIIAGLAASHAPLFAAQLAAYIHGLAGDLASAELGQTALIASDLLRYLPAAFKTVEASQ